MRSFWPWLPLCVLASPSALLSQESDHRPEWMQQAMQELRAAPKYSHPFFWAPFVLVGDYR
jgi:CHAT domain-containing protein